MSRFFPIDSRAPASSPQDFLLGQAWQARLPLILSAAAGLMVSILVVIQARLTAGIISRVFINNQSLVENSTALRWLLLVILLRAAAVTLVEVAAHASARGIKSRLRLDILSRLDNPLFLRREQTGELALTVQDGIERLDAFFSQYLPGAAQAVLCPLVIILTIFPLDGISAWILLITGPLVPFFMVLIGKAVERKTQKQWSALSRLGAHFLDTIQGLTDLKILGRSQDQAAALHQNGEGYRLASMEVLRITFLSALALEWLATLSTALLAVQIGLRLLAGGLALEESLVVLILAPEFFLPLRNLGLRFHAAQAGVTAARRLVNVLAQNPPHHNPSTSISQVNLDPGGNIPPIRFENVAYQFSEADGAALVDVSFTLLPGSHTALVGASGAGKTTILQLLLGFMQPSSGKILVGDTPLDQLDPEAWRSLCSWVPEKPHLFHTTLFENIRLGSPLASLEEVQTASRLAGLHEWIVSLPHGYETSTGEGAGRLSAGQAQRLALARAFLKNAPLLLLDEPTSSLDPQLSSDLSEIIQTLAAGKTVLSIAHRLHTIQSADQVLVLDDGRLVEAGKPSNLVQNNGAYARLISPGRAAP